MRGADGVNSNKSLKTSSTSFFWSNNRDSSAFSHCFFNNFIEIFNNFGWWNLHKNALLVSIYGMQQCSLAVVKKKFQILRILTEISTATFWRNYVYKKWTYQVEHQLDVINRSNYHSLPISNRYRTGTEVSFSKSLHDFKINRSSEWNWSRFKAFPTKFTKKNKGSMRAFKPVQLL